MATEKQILKRIQSTTSISKITKSMKMVSASKLRGDQNRLALARPFAKWTASVYEEPLPCNLEERGEERELQMGENNLIVTLTSDRGLCGGVNTWASKYTVQAANDIVAHGKPVNIFVVGEKGRGQLRRLARDHLVGSATDASKLPYNFSQVCAIAMEVCKHDFTTAHVVFNKFVSAIAYETHIQTLERASVPATADEGEDPMVEYEFEPENKDEVLEDMYEYSLACAMYGNVMESATSEQSSRMNAMENASKNASEMIESLTLQYNRARQARITTELIEIISGASAIEDSN
eukprot:CAMPEP_0182452694 /NCGR_PEP_ID=MMETSP1319-20130603/43_1 /TAXON_ID=172717 /ORGANISM="Bolidomonas pacifica, Strain RCC208" /LENGTH=291 /DNA_ID=CAMNT_0024650543 /DNA_START=68 /DNA_END=941 /DNA_ORIENTATION=+